jgi:hypothetical protein
LATSIADQQHLIAAMNNSSAALAARVSAQQLQLATQQSQLDAQQSLLAAQQQLILQQAAVLDSLDASCFVNFRYAGFAPCTSQMWFGVCSVQSVAGPSLQSSDGSSAIATNCPTRSRLRSPGHGLSSLRIAMIVLGILLAFGLFAAVAATCHHRARSAKLGWASALPLVRTGPALEAVSLPAGADHRVTQVAVAPLASGQG